MEVELSVHAIIKGYYLFHFKVNLGEQFTAYCKGENVEMHLKLPENMGSSATFNPSFCLLVFMSLFLQLGIVSVL